MANEDRIAALRQRLQRSESETKPQEAQPMPTQAPAPTKAGERSPRARHTLYLDKALVKQLDQAFRAAAHDLYPQTIEKADYLEACLRFALEHQDEIRTALTV